MGDSVIVTGKEQNLKQQLTYNHETHALLHLNLSVTKLKCMT